MEMPFPGMDPYLEQPVLWEGVHKRLVVAIANQLQPQLDPRYVASIEARVLIEGPQRLIPDVWVRKIRETGRSKPQTNLESDSAVALEVDELEIHEPRVEILDLRRDSRLVSVIEVVSPTNKRAGPGRESYLTKQAEVLARDCHLVEIDLHRRGRNVLSIPKWRLRELGSFDYLVCVSRHPLRNRFELYPRHLRQRLPRIRLPLAKRDSDVMLDIQSALAQVYADGRYMWLVNYEKPCKPRLQPADQQWAEDCWADYRKEHPELFPTETKGEPSGGATKKRRKT